ncbi:lysophosphatidic acid receptor 5 [Spea bombifrons]|uniref:lysophosphatidic acid receptor 5 n=1 Tax=Spea bombifrons TaxID=233779 RepID=UPI00234AA2E6|nr:lysophosphatidic acid receptor 5 [Spea bombifrons]
MLSTTDKQVSAMVANVSIDSCEAHTPLSSRTLLLVGYSMLLPLGVLLNGVSLFVFLRWLRPLSVVGIFLCNLALSDLLFSLSLPFRVYYYANHHWPFGSFLCRFSGSIFHINMYGSCLFLLCINVDRYLAIVHPLRFRHLRRRKIARLTCLAVWLLIVSGSVPAALVHSSTNCWDGDSEVPRCFEGLSKWQGRVLPLLLVAEVLGFLLPLGGVLYGSCHVFWELCKAQEGQQRHKKTIKLLTLNLVIFIFCFVPYNTVLVAYGLLRAKLVPDVWNAMPVLKKILSVTVLLASTNCVLDPMIYYFSTEGFRKTLHKLSRISKSSNTKGSSGSNSKDKVEPIKEILAGLNTEFRDNDGENKGLQGASVRVGEVNGKDGKKLLEESEI